MKRIIIFLIRRRLGIKKYENFRFKNQSSESDFYYFESERLMKVVKCKKSVATLSNVSLNWLLNDECEIIKL